MNYRPTLPLSAVVADDKVDHCYILEFVAGGNLSKPVTAMYGMNVLAEIPQSLRQGSPNEARNVEAILASWSRHRCRCTFFLSDGSMAQRGRCPGGRPSVSANKRIHDAYYSVVKWQLYKPSKNTEYDQQSPRECRYLYWRVQWHPAIKQQVGGQSKACRCGAPAFRVVREGLVMAPPRARMTNDRSTGVAVKVKLAGIGTIGDC